MRFCSGLFFIVYFKARRQNALPFNWTYYTPDSVIKQFEEEFGANVWIDSYASNEEMFAKLLAGAASYDIVFPSQDYASIMIKLDMLKKIDLSKIPNAQNISPLVLEKPFTIPRWNTAFRITWVRRALR